MSVILKSENIAIPGPDWFRTSKEYEQFQKEMMQYFDDQKVLQENRRQRIINHDCEILEDDPK